MDRAASTTRARADAEAHGKSPTRPRRGAAALAGGSKARRGAESAYRHGLSRPLHGSGIHLSMPDYGSTGFRALRDRLRAGKIHPGVEIAEDFSGRSEERRVG